MTNILADPPALTFDIANRGIGSSPADICQGHARRIGPAENCKGFGVAQIVVEAISDIEVVGEQECAPAKSARCVARPGWIEHAG